MQTSELDGQIPSRGRFPAVSQSEPRPRRIGINHQLVAKLAILAGVRPGEILRAQSGRKETLLDDIRE